MLQPFPIPRKADPFEFRKRRLFLQKLGAALTVSDTESSSPSAFCECLRDLRSYARRLYQEKTHRPLTDEVEQTEMDEYQETGIDPGHLVMAKILLVCAVADVCSSGKGDPVVIDPRSLVQLSWICSRLLETSQDETGGEDGASDS